jgi:hypothetical protein
VSSANENPRGRKNRHQFCRLDVSLFAVLERESRKKRLYHLYVLRIRSKAIASALRGSSKNVFIFLEAPLHVLLAFQDIEDGIPAYIYCRIDNQISNSSYLRSVLRFGGGEHPCQVLRCRLTNSRLTWK